MARIHDTSRAQIAFEVEGFDPDQFLVSRYRGTEGLSQLSRFEIELVSEDVNVAFDAIGGKPAVLSIFATYGNRWIHGLVSRLEHIDQAVGRAYLRAELVPALWLLAHRYQSRIFQGKGVLQIVADVLARAGLPQDYLHTENLTQGDYPEREFCVQYRETDLNFISRLLEDVGVCYFFEQGESGHKMVLVDSRAAYAPIGDVSALPYKPPSAMNVSEEHIFRFRFSQEVRPGAVALNDYAFKKPALGLLAKQNRERDLGLEFSDYPGEYTTAADGEKRATLRTEEFEVGRQIGVGQSNCHRLVPGRTFEVAEHPTTAFNRA